jgi:hypothetical protein
MIRGTTAQFKFKLPYLVSEVKEVTVNFWQNNNAGTISAPLPITKTLESCATTDNPYEISVTLIPHETARFSSYRKGYVQLEAETIDGITFGNTPQMFSVYPNQNIEEDEDVPGGDPDDEDFIILDGGNIAEE